MLKIAIACALLFGVAEADAPKAPELIGKWRVTGCETSPRDPANCMHGTITFSAKRWSIDLPCCKRASDYVVVSKAAGRIKIASEGRESEIAIDDRGTASWWPDLGGRTRTLSFVRVR